MSGIQEGLSRRSLLAAGLAGGFALATQPVRADAITTSADGLEAGPVSVTTSNGVMPAYWAKPAGATGTLPVVLVVQEIFGVHEHIQDLCRRLAHLGYLAIAPELYFRYGDPRQFADVPTLIRDLVSRVPDSEVMADLDATVDWALGRGGDAARVAITGFCWGGRIVWLYAAHSDRLQAAAAWYGRLDGARTPLQPAYPLDVAKRLNAPVIGLYGGEDKGIPLTSVRAMEDALRAARQPSAMVVYGNAGHAFNADYRPSYQAAAAKDGWQSMLRWFRSHGV
ncbi:dienelactone hydrolase family protein [Chitinibacteraceae bacterium HSL-7]